jgi:hypothetical protein
MTKPNKFRRMFTVFATWAGVLAIVLGGTASAVNFAQDRQIDQVVAQIEQDRIAADTQSCESGNRLRASIRELAYELGAQETTLIVVETKFADRDCSTVIGATERTVADLGLTDAAVVYDLGGRKVNGSCRDLFSTADYTAVDQWPGDGVDVVVDAAVWQPERLCDVALSTEVLEHAEQWREIVANMASMVRPGGFVIITCATHERRPHSAVHGGGLEHGEYYGNVPERELGDALGLSLVDVHTETVELPEPHFSDLYAWARKP